MGFKDSGRQLQLKTVGAVRKAAAFVVGHRKKADADDSKNRAWFFAFCLLIYFPLGMLISQGPNMLVNQNQGEFNTWMSELIHVKWKTEYADLFTYMVLSTVVSSIGSVIIFRYSHKAGSFDVMKMGSVVYVLVVVLSQIPSSSIMRLFYEAGYSSVVLASILTWKLFLESKRVFETQNEEYEELWDLFKFLFSLSVGFFPLVIGGVGFLSIFTKGANKIEQIHVYRHIGLAVYFEIGALGLVILPLLKRICELRRAGCTFGSKTQIYYPERDKK